MQLLSNRSDRFGNTAVRIGPTVLVDPFLQLVYGNSSHDVKGVRHIKIVRGKKPRYPMLYYHIGDFVLLGCKILQALFRKLKVVATGSGPDPKGVVSTITISVSYTHLTLPTIYSV